jgi:cysteine desulfurase
MLYFDHNATTPLSAAAREAWLEACDKFPGNPSSPHRIGSRADAAMQDARQRLAGILGCDPYGIVWTSGATEANNTALAHFAATADASAEVWVSAIEHPCVMQAATHYFGKRCRHIPVERSGIVDLTWLADELGHRRPALLAVMAANNETGVLQPWREVLAMCRQWEVPVLCDAVQSIGKLPANGLGECDFLSGSAHKFGGPKGVGFLKCPDSPLSPLLRGGPQEEGRRAGTENVAGVLSMVAALEEREQRLKSAEHRIRLEWREAFVRDLVAALPGVEIVGGSAERLWNTVSVVMPELDGCQRWVVKLDKAGYAVSTGSACSSGKEQPSHVLEAMGYEAVGRVIRISSGWDTTENDWKQLLEGTKGIAAVRGSTHPH